MLRALFSDSMLVLRCSIVKIYLNTNYPTLAYTCNLVKFIVHIRLVLLVQGMLNGRVRRLFKLQLLYTSPNLGWELSVLPFALVWLDDYPLFSIWRKTFLISSMRAFPYAYNHCEQSIITREKRGWGIFLPSFNLKKLIAPIMPSFHDP